MTKKQKLIKINDVAKKSLVLFQFHIMDEFYLIPLPQWDKKIKSV